jgi:arylsulfatase A-like enzyme
VKRRTRRISAVVCAALFGCASVGWAANSPSSKPNIIIIVADDMGWADSTLHGDARFPTPNIDSIARAGVRFTNGYVASSVCSPSRAALLTGRYPQRFGHEHNLHPQQGDVGLPVSEALLPALLKPLDYRTLAVGKWHLGMSPKFRPLQRGFDHFYGFLKGRRTYRALLRESYHAALWRDRQVTDEHFDYLTDTLAEAAAAYIDDHHERPFLLYLAFSAVHGPLDAPAELIEAQVEFSSRERRILAAMTVSLDNAIGVVLERLQRYGLRDDTLLFFVNDNGGADANHANNAPFRGVKGTPYEGGIRVPFLVQWPAVLPAGQVYDEPVSALDILPTAVAAAGGELRPGHVVDGVDLIPFLTGQAAGTVPHEALFWRRGDNYAVREGDWKLVRSLGWRPALRSETPRLFDLRADPGESKDLAQQHPERVARMQAAYRRWSEQMAEPLWGAPRPRKRSAAKAR